MAKFGLINPIGMLSVAIVALALGMNGAGAASAKPRPKVSSVCRQINAQILANEKQLGYLTSESIGEDSPVRATMWSNRSSAIFAEINSSKVDLRAHGCPAYPHPISRSNFLISAQKCAIADLEAQIASVSADPLDAMRDRIDAAGGKHPSDSVTGPNPCDRSTWTR